MLVAIVILRYPYPITITLFKLMNTRLATMVLEIQRDPSKKTQLTELLAKRSYPRIMDKSPAFP